MEQPRISHQNRFESQTECEAQCEKQIYASQAACIVNVYHQSCFGEMGSREGREMEPLDKGKWRGLRGAWECPSISGVEVQKTYMFDLREGGIWSWKNLLHGRP